MKTQIKFSYAPQAETLAGINSIHVNVIDGQSARLGLANGEPLLVIADALLRYAKAYKARFGDNIGDDYHAATAFSDMLSGVKVLLDHDGGVALERGITTDSKSNGAMSELLDGVCQAAGIDFQNI